MSSGSGWTRSHADVQDDEQQHLNSTQSLPSQGTYGPSLWNAVRERVQATAAIKRATIRYRNSRIEQQGSVDAEGMSTGTVRSRADGSIAPGQHAAQWQSLAHLFDEDQIGDERQQQRESKRRSKRASSIRPNPAGLPVSSPNQRITSQYAGDSSMIVTDASTSSILIEERTSSLPSASTRHSRPGTALSSETSIESNPKPTLAKSVAWKRMVSPPRAEMTRSTSDLDTPDMIQEPNSWLQNDPEETPEGEDPLLYTSQDQLLESDVESSDSEWDERFNEPKRMNGSADRQATSKSQASRLQRWTSQAVANIKKKTPLDNLQKSIAKCAIAYLVASLFTFWPFLSTSMAKLLPNHDPDAQVSFSNLHMIATVAVYFHPAKTIGAMLEADIFALGAFLYAIVLGFTSMAIAVFLHERDLLFVSDVMSVLFFLGFGMALVGYAKVKVGKPQFNTACSLINIIVFTVVVKEGSKHLGHFSTEKTFQVFLVVLAGSLVTNVVCFLFWPQSATTNLQNDIERNLQGFATLLRVLIKTFLLDDPSNFHFKSEQIKRAIDDHHDSFTSLRKNLGEAKLESLLDLRMRGKRKNYVAATDSINRLAQHLAGLRSSCGLQHQIMTAHKQARKARETSGEAQVASDQKRLSGIEIADALRSSDPDNFGADGQAEERATAFQDFVQSVGPHMRSLVFTCSRTLKRLRSTFVASQHGRPYPTERQTTALDGGANGEQQGSRYVYGTSFDLLEQDVSAALDRFQHEQTIAIKRIYTMEPKKMEEQRAAAAQASSSSNFFTKVHPDEEIFLIFFFVFNLEEFAKELEVLIEALEAIRQSEAKLAQARATSWWQRIKLFFGTIHTPSGGFFSGKRRASKRGRGSRRTESAVLDFPSNRRHLVNTGQTPVALTSKQRFQRFIWSVGELLRQPDTKFAIKAGVGCALLASPAFFESTRHIFTKFQGQWALVSFMVVLSPTVGQSNQMSIHRILGTLLGAAAAVGIYTLFPDNNVALPIFGLFFSLPCFKYIVGKPQLASSGRFVLLTYNLTALYSYNLRKVGIEVEQIAYQRTVSVVIGVLWATILNQLVWPFEARRELALRVSDLIFKLAWLYQRLVLSYSEDPAQRAGGDGSEEDDEDLDEHREEQPLLRSRQTRISDEFQTIELHLQVTIIKLEGLLAQTKHEPRLKGPFPIATYKAMLGCCQNILDKLHSMRCVTTRQDWYREVRRDFVIPVNTERREMVGNVLLFFYTLGSAFHLKIPVPPYFPPASECRTRLLEKIRELPVVKKRAVRGSSAYLLFYSYALAIKDVIDQLEELGRLTQQNFGIWGGSIDDFERHFRSSPESAIATPYASKRSSRTNIAG